MPSVPPASDPNAPAAPSYPVSPRYETASTVHGVNVADPYRWLEPQDDPAVQQWVMAQHVYSRKALDALPTRAALRERYKDILYLDAISRPEQRGGRYFYTRRLKTKEKSILYVRPKGGEERVLIDPNTLSADGSTSLGSWYPSYDGKRVAYTLRENNADEATLYVRDVDSGKDLPDVIAGAKYARPSWTPDNAGFYYEWLPVDPAVTIADRPGYTEIRYHRLGSDPHGDARIFPALYDPKTFLYSGVSEDGRWLFVGLQYGWNRNDLYVRDTRVSVPPLAQLPRADLLKLDTPERLARYAGQLGFRPFAAGIDATFGVNWWDGAFYVKTNYQAPNSRVLKVDPDRLSLAHWREIVPESDAKLDDASIIGGKLALSYLRNAASEIELRDLEGKPLRKVALPGIGSSSGISGNPELDEAYFSFTSFAVPGEIYQTSIKTGQTSLWAKIDLPIDTSQNQVEQVRYTSKDGTSVSMFILHKKGVVLDGSNPTLLTGYGGFNVDMTPDFSTLAAVWLERGGVYAVPNLRGGGEYGEAWHRAGMGANKQNVFDDFIAAAEALIRLGYTRPEKLAISGGSNGGLLVGAVMTQRPELFRAVVCSVPLLDMVRYHQFGSGKTWIEEYGSADDPAQFRTLYAYSPYHHVKKGAPYPALLMMAADHDDRVDPMHARKFAAAIQWASSRPDHPVLFRLEEQAGHGGADLVKKRVESLADITAFLLDQLGAK
jgi:prolyl oligopeptidase